MICIVRSIGVIFPRPSELAAAIKSIRESDHDLSLLLLVLTEPLLRFRLCAIAHLMEAAFAPIEDIWDGEHPRVLFNHEMDFVMKKLQDFFSDLFQQPTAQTSLRCFFTNVHEWTMQCLTVQDDDESVAPQFPNVVKEIFPCYRSIYHEYRNILTCGKTDKILRSQVHQLFKFVMLSLKEPRFTSASDWTTEGRRAFQELQKTLSGVSYRGPARRLFRTVVGMTEQLWEGGEATDTSLAIEKCLTNVIRMSLSSDLEVDQGIDAAGSWDIMQDFQRLIRAADDNIGPIHLPSITWTRGNSEICLDSMVIQFPRLMTNNIKLDSKMDFDESTRRWRRQWHLKM